MQALEGFVDSLGAIATSPCPAQPSVRMAAGSDLPDSMPWADAHPALPSLARRLELRNAYAGILQRGGHLGC